MVHQGSSEATPGPFLGSPGRAGGQERHSWAGSGQGFDLTRDLTYQFPDFEAPEGKTADGYLEDICLASARELYGWSAPKVEERLRQLGYL